MCFQVGCSNPAHIYWPLVVNWAVCDVSIESLHEGKLITCSVTGVVRRRPTAEMIDQVNPEKLSDNLWGCPFCLLSEFHNIGEVSP